jgi:tyrosinase
MDPSKSLTTRLSIQELDHPGNEQKKNDFLKAWKLIKELPPSNPNSFWSIASYHGMPFKSRGEDKSNTGDDSTWDSYCQHSNVLFPLWHRYYCHRLEQALQTAVPGTALHYWDQTAGMESITDVLHMDHIIPNILTDKTVTIDGHEQPNPLLNFVLNKEITGNDKSRYVKPLGYTTKRYPYSSIQNPPDCKEIADKYNASIDKEIEEKRIDIMPIFIKYVFESFTRERQLYGMFKASRDNSDYNSFSNTETAAGHVRDSLEQPHNEVHLAVGGHGSNIHRYQVNEKNGNLSFDDASAYEQAEGDMGIIETAGFDPIFFIHHANIDRMFWVWQKKWKNEDTINIRYNKEHPDPGVTPDQGQGPSIGQTEGLILSLKTPLPPFQDEYGVVRNGEGCINIEKQLGYTYSIGSLDQESWPEPMRKSISFKDVKHEKKTITELKEEHRKIMTMERAYMKHAPVVLTDITDHFKHGNIDNVSTDFPPRNTDETQQSLTAAAAADPILKHSYHISVAIDKDAYPGSFAVHFSCKIDGKWKAIGMKGVLARWNRKSCPNCQKHRFVKIDMEFTFDDALTYDDFKIHIISKHQVTGHSDIQPLDAEKADVKFYMKSEDREN